MKKSAFIYIISACIFWGTSGIFVEYLAPFGFSSPQMTFVRGTVAFVCMLLYVLIRDINLFKTNLKELLFFMGSGLAFYFTATCYFQSMQLTSVSTAVVLMYTAPIFVMIYSVTFLDEKLTKTKLIALVTMLIGCGLVSGIIGGLKFNVLGIAIGFMSGISYAAYNILTKIQMQKGINPVKANLYCFLFSIIIGLFLSNPYGIPSLISQNPLVTVSLCTGMGIFACILPYFLYSTALRYIPAGTASSLGIIEPMSATIFSVLILGEEPSIYLLVGIALVLGAVFLLGKNN
ncbi:MAG: EamA family transporter [Clostridia bacterium]|nr:EamA family transporter [Clostridia bacterium]